MNVISKLPASGTTIFTAMSALAAASGALNLSQGFPDYDGPLALREALARNVMAGINQYTPMVGVLALREQIAAKLERYYQIVSCPDTEITVLPGATEAIFAPSMRPYTAVTRSSYWTPRLIATVPVSSSLEALRYMSRCRRQTFLLTGTVLNKLSADAAP